MYYFGYIEEDANNGTGIRLTIFISGCNHNCDGCHSPESHDFHYGKEFNEEEQNKILNLFRDEEMLYDGITISGGDPIYSYEEVLDFIKKFKSEFKDKTIWLYTGFSLNDVQQIASLFPENILDYIDTIVTEPFIKEYKDLGLKFMGSSNQKIINCKNLQCT